VKESGIADFMYDFFEKGAPLFKKIMPRLGNAKNQSRGFLWGDLEILKQY